jgi:hypothetical protein|tara:strand:+ start:100 stop:330 length:231 start_codon:yes stop_codon:yes gene_type:complete
LENSDWNLTNEEWMKLSRCTKAARQLYPYSGQMQDAWARQAYYKWAEKGVSPEAQRDKQAPNILKTLAKHPPKFNY